MTFPPLLPCDGILLDGQTLYVVRNAENLLIVVDLDVDLLSGWIRWSGTSPAFRFPTALAKAGDRLLIVNGQLDQMGPGLHPDLPFTVTSIPDPAQEQW